MIIMYLAHWKSKVVINYKSLDVFNHETIIKRLEILTRHKLWKLKETYHSHTLHP